MNISEFSKLNNFPLKKSHYEFSKLRKNISRFVPVLNFEKLGFLRSIILFDDATVGLKIASTMSSFSVNNSIRLDSGLFVEYVFFSVEEKELFIASLIKKNVSFKHFAVDCILKQEGFITDWI